MTKVEQQSTNFANGSFCVILLRRTANCEDRNKKKKTFAYDEPSFLRKSSRTLSCDGRRREQNGISTLPGNLCTKKKKKQNERIEMSDY